MKDLLEAMDSRRKMYVHLELAPECFLYEGPITCYMCDGIASLGKIRWCNVLAAY